MSDLTNYRQDLAVLDPAGGSRNTRNLPNVAPSGAATGLNREASSYFQPHSGTSFYNDSSDNASLSSQVSPSFRSAQNPPGAGRHLSAPDSPDPHDERRPSFASITTLSSQGSKNSMARGGLRKLQGFFGEEFPGSDTSLPPPAVPPKDNRPRSFSHSRQQRGRNYSNATDNTRDASPSSSRPRTPVPAPEVVPFLYQEADVGPHRASVCPPHFLLPRPFLISCNTDKGSYNRTLRGMAKLLSGTFRPAQTGSDTVMRSSNLLPRRLPPLDQATQLSTFPAIAITRATTIHARFVRA